MRLLGIDVSDDLVARWCRLLAPARQPFFVDPDDHLEAELDPELTDDQRCTYTVWRIRRPRAVVWHDEASFAALPRPERARLVRAQADRGRGAVPSVRRWGHLVGPAAREQADGHRFVWWPALLDDHPEPVLRARVEDGQLPSRHSEVDGPTWRDAADVLPGVRDIVGAFPPSSGPNCFGATLAAAGDRPPDARVLQDEFEVPRRALRPGRGAWCRRRPGHRPRLARSRRAPVADVAQLIRINRSAGLRLERHRLADGPRGSSGAPTRRASPRPAASGSATS